VQIAPGLVFGLVEHDAGELEHVDAGDARAGLAPANRSIAGSRQRVTGGL
jgi:hypothetical protein